MKTDEHYLKKELDSLFTHDPSLFDFLLNGSFDGVWYWDLENPEHKWLSRNFWETLGYDPSEKEHLAIEWQQKAFPEGLKVALENFDKHCADPEYPCDQVVRYRHKNGCTAWVRCRGTAIRDDAGKPIRMLSVHTDLTKKIIAEEKLRESEELHRITMENILDPVFITDDLGEITFACPNIQHILGFSNDEVKAMGNISSFFGEKLFNLEELNEHGHISNIEATIMSKNGEQREYLVTVRRVSIENGTAAISLNADKSRNNIRIQ